MYIFSSIYNFRQSAKKTFFSNAKSGDLIITSRSGEIESLLYLIFQIGTPTNNIRWKSFKDIQNHPDVKWAIPISLGDSHKQYRVFGTSSDYFKKIQIKNKKLEFYKGEHFKDIFDVVIGYDVAKTLNYKLNDKIISDEKLIIDNQYFKNDYLKLSVGKKRHIKIELD